MSSKLLNPFRNMYFNFRNTYLNFTTLFGLIKFKTIKISKLEVKLNNSNSKKGLEIPSSLRYSLAPQSLRTSSQYPENLESYFAN